jgi:hypothetical protein
VKPATTRLIGGGLLAVPLAGWPAAVAAQPPQKQIEYGPTQDNPIGHTAIALTGNTTPAGSSPTEYLLGQAKRRDTTLFYLKAKEALEKLYAVGGDNCATRINGALDAAGIPPLVYTNNSARLWP